MAEKTGKSKGGRPRLLDDPLKRSNLVGLVSMGASLQAAAAIVGVHIHTLQRALARDRELRDQIEQAEARDETNLVLNIGKAAKDARHWRAAVWRLERKWPERYRRQPPYLFTLDEVRMALRTFFRIAVDELPEGDPRKSLSRRCGRVLRGLKRRARKKQIRRELRDLERLAGPPEREMQRWEAPPEGEPVPEPQGERGEGID